MKKFLLCVTLLVNLYGTLYAQDEIIENKYLKNIEWNDNYFDLRLVNIPKTGVFYNFSDNDIVYRVSIPFALPVLLITPINITYASSYWGFNGILLDVTFTFVPYIWEVFYTKLNVFTFSESILLRFLPLEIWGGIPLSSKGMGIYFLLEISPFNIFNTLNDNFKIIYYGIGLNVGIKYIISRHLEFELKYENYISYMDKDIRKEYIGIIINYRILKPGIYGVW